MTWPTLECILSCLHLSRCDKTQINRNKIVFEIDTSNKNSLIYFKYYKTYVVIVTKLQQQPTRNYTQIDNF